MAGTDLYGKPVAGPKAAPVAANPAGLMDRATWEAKARANAAAAGTKWNAPEADINYDAYTYGAKHAGTAGGKRSGDFGDEYNVSGPDVTGMRKKSLAAGESGLGGENGYNRWSESALASWEKHKDPACPPDNPYRSIHDGGCVGKPMDRSRPGPGAGGGGGVGGPGGGGPGGGGPGGGAPGGGYGDDPEIYNYLKQTAMNPGTWRDEFMKTGGFTDPQAQADQLRAQIDAMPDGVEKQTALARMPETLSQMKAGLGRDIETQRLSMLSNPLMGQESTYKGMGLDWQKALLANKLGYAGLDVQRYGIDQNTGLGYGQLGLDQAKFSDYAGAYRDWQTGQNAADRAAKQAEWSAQIKAGQPSGAQKVLGGVGTALKTGKSIWDLYQDVKGKK